FILPNRPMVASNDVTGGTVGADVAAQSYGLDGRGVGVAVIDSGIDANHEDFSKNSNGGGGSRIVYAENFVDSEATTQDLYGHGTHVAGTIAGNGAASNGGGSFRSLKGIAPGANLINLRVLDSHGSGTESSVIVAIERAVSLKSLYNIRVINL